MKSLSFHHQTQALQYCVLPSPHSVRHAHPRHHRRHLQRTITATASVPATTERDEWVSSVRNTTGRVKHRLWAPHLSLDPPPLLADIAVVLVSPKRPTSVGSVARALSCFECIDLRIVNPRCDPRARSARNGSKGAQYLLWRATSHETLEDAIDGATTTVAFTRWLNGLHGVPSYRSMKSFLDSVDLSSSSIKQDMENSNNESDKASSRNKLVLVFGREEDGLLPEEVTACSAACSIPIGRLQESLSLSHAVSLVLAPLFEARQERLLLEQGSGGRGRGGGRGDGSGGGEIRGGMVNRREDLAVGVQPQDD